MALVYQAFRVGRDRVVDEHVHVVFRSQECADVTLQCKVWPVRELYFFGYVGHGFVNQLPHFCTHCLLPIWQ